MLNNKPDVIAQTLACSIWLILALAQILFVLLRIHGLIDWPWWAVLIPLWIFCLLPAVEVIGAWLIENTP
jgi:hypothetical protein